MGPTLVIMAAGMGSRYGGIKQIDPIGPNGEVILDYSVYDAIRAGFEKVVFVIRQAIEEPFRALVDAHFGGRVSVAYVYQELPVSLHQRRADVGALLAAPALSRSRTGAASSAPTVERRKPWGTAHAVLCARPEVSGPFAVINADDFYGAESFRVLATALALRDGAPDYLLVGFALERTLSQNGPVSRGVIEVDPHGRMRKIVERTEIEAHAAGVRYRDGEQWRELAPGTVVSMNMWGFTEAIFDELEAGFESFRASAGPTSEYLIPTVVDGLITRGVATVDVLRSNAAWFGVTYPADKPAVVSGVCELITAGEYPERLWTH